MTDSSTDTKPPGDAASRMFDKVGMAVVIEVLAGIVIAVFGLVFQFGGHGEPPTPTRDPTPPFSTPITDWPSASPTDWPPTTEAAVTNPYADVEVGDCFTNAGSTDAFDLAYSDCDPGAFEVVEIYGGDDGDDCDGVDRSMFGHAPGYGSVFCLSYLHPWGDAYYAESGECVTRLDDDTYTTTDCAPGDLQVLETFWGEEGSYSCSEWEYYNSSLDFPGYIDDQDLLLCMRIVYPDDMGFAEVDDCLYTSGSGDDRTFEFVDCSQANAYVTGRTGEYNDTAFCGSHGSAYWQSYTFPEHAYTVCWNWL
ncbi:hypothetical protein GCM10009830_40870 [Glycomyces endophyticus]|uniref:Uncharacterized protein n=1 Tax=Glycomyces endophyticus TaxID=480996 RepID=A0ABN2HK51_9ACTN